MRKYKPLNVRNKNPLNIKKNKLYAWVGEIGSDIRGFVRFDTVEHGFRAAYRNMMTYKRKYNLNTIDGIINRWTQGDSELIQDNYKSFLASHVGIGIHEQLSQDNYAQMLLSMSYFEGAKGRNAYSLEQVNQGIALA